MSEAKQAITTSWHSYAKLFTLGHAAIHDLLLDPVVVEEKIDGSQFSFGVFDGELRCRSKGAQLNTLAPEKMFIQGVETAQKLLPLLRDGWTYRGEYLAKPKHNALAYTRIPSQHFIGFDINPGHETYLTYEEKMAEFERLGLETVPCLYAGKLDDVTMLRELLERTSVLGGQNIEGVVIKNYTRFGKDGKALMGKFVSEAFKEVHKGDWRDSNPGQGDIIDRLITSYRTPARWAKAIQHLREAGRLEDSPTDIPEILKEIVCDVETECSDEIKQILFDWAWSSIKRGVTKGMPEWYKEQLMKLQFATSQENA